VSVPAFFGTLPGWITAISSSGVFGLVVWGFIRHGADILRALNERRQQSLSVDAERRGEKRADLTDCHRRLDAMSLEMSEVRAEVSELKMKLLGTISAYRMLDLEVETHLPGSTALGQARVVMSTAFALSPSTPERGPTQ
jgi:hypothetical protein